jgi:hypothetical protein
MQAELFKENMPPEQRQQAFDLVHKEMNKLNHAQRREVEQVMRENFERRMDKQIAAYFALPKAQRAAYLDKQIDEMEKMRKDREARQPRSGQAGAGQSGGPRGGGPSQANPAGPRPPPNLNSDAMAQRRAQRLDRTTATQRAMRATYFADLQQRRAQRGMPPMPGHGGR